MKNLACTSVFLLVVCFLASCSKNKYEDAIAEYEQTIFESKIDLGFKAIDIKEVKVNTVADSISYCKEFCDTRIAEAKAAMDKQYDKIKDYTPEDSISSFMVRMDLIDYRKSNRDYDEALDFADYVQKNVLSRYENKDPNEPLLVIVQCKYSIKNPFLNNQKQEITNKYYMSPDGKICYGTVDDDEGDD